jgi:DNA-directed RNA polymerase alpha subunit
MNDTDALSITEVIELVRQMDENWARVIERDRDERYRQGIEDGQIQVRNEIQHALDVVILANDQHPSARALKIYATSVDELVANHEIRKHTFACLIKAQLITIGDIKEKKAEELLALKDFSKASLREVQIMLGKRGLALKK